MLIYGVVNASPDSLNSDSIVTGPSSALARAEMLLQQGADAIDLGGQARFGPDVEWVDEIAYDVDPKRAEVFYAAIRNYWPGLPDGALAPGYSGMRPKLQKPGEPAKDFLIQGPRETGIPGLVNLYGIESPGLTSALAIADHVVGLLKC